MYIEMLKGHFSSFLSNILVGGRKQANNFKVALYTILQRFEYHICLNILDPVSFRVPRSVHRPMHRLIYRSILDRCTTDI